jgi:hydroxymethylglutaryl-CoA lyase
MENRMKILETPRDAMQGLVDFIPTDKKTELINAILRVGFDIVDIGSFVPSKVIPQFSDLKQIIKKLDYAGSKSEIFTLVVNKKGAREAIHFEEINYLGYPFSTSAIFLKKNINSDFSKAIDTIDHIQNLCFNSGKKFLLYESMAFSNPYGDPSGIDEIYKWTKQFSEMGIQTISLSDIIGEASPLQIAETYKILTHDFPGIDFGIHLHIKNDAWYDKIDAAWQNGCQIFDGVLNGKGGCPMTGYEMLGNLPTMNLLEYAKKNSIHTQIDEGYFNKAWQEFRF